MCRYKLTTSFTNFFLYSFSASDLIDSTINPGRIYEHLQKTLRQVLCGTSRLCGLAMEVGTGKINSTIAGVVPLPVHLINELFLRSPS